MRVIEVKLVGDPSLSGETIQFEVDSDSFRLLGRSLELMYLTKGNRRAVTLILESETRKTSLYLKGYVDVALAAYCDVDNYIPLIAE